MPRFFPSLQAAAEAASFSHLAIGFFDGLHLGHRAVVCHGRSPQDLARVCVFTFEPHPIAVLNPAHKPPLLTGLPHKLKILESWGVDSVLGFPFDLQRSTQEPLDFLRELTQNLPFVRSLSVGTRWRFGHQRRGDVEMLGSFCRDLGIEVQICPPVENGGEMISSSRLRTIIQAGGLETAAAMLGRPYEIFGNVVRGNQLGRTLGVPTANLHTLDECFPPAGVYAGKATLSDGSSHAAAVNLGHRPSVDAAATLQIEAHLLDFSGDLYGREIRIEPRHFLRPEQKFASLDDLKSAISRDIASTRRLMSSAL